MKGYFFLLCNSDLKKKYILTNRLAINGIISYYDGKAILYDTQVCIKIFYISVYIFFIHSIFSKNVFKLSRLFILSLFLF